MSEKNKQVNSEKHLKQLMNVKYAYHNYYHIKNYPFVHKSEMCPYNSEDILLSCNVDATVRVTIASDIF